MYVLRYYGLLVGICLCLYLPGIGSLPFFDRDEPHFAQASRQMVSEHQYWDVNFQYQPRHLKPPGIYWLQAISVNLFSSAESQQTWPYRLPSVLGALMAVLLLFEFARRFTDPKTALIAATFLACSILLMVEAHLAVTDAALLGAMMLMQWGLAQVYLRSSSLKPGTIGAALFWIGMSLGMFIKGITPLVGGLTILGLCIADKQTPKPWLKNLGWWWGLPLFLMTTLIWLIPFSIASGHNFLWDMIHGDVLPKLTHGQQSHGMWPGYYGLSFTLAFWPASLWAVPAGVWAWKNRHLSIIRFLLAWILPTWLFFELIPTKLPEYVLPTYPAIALLIAMAMHNGLPQIKPGLLKNLAMLQQSLWAIVSAILAAGFIYLGGWGWAAGSITLFGAIYLWTIYYRKPHHPSLGLGMVVCAGGLILIWQITLPHMTSLWMSKQISQSVAKISTELVNWRNPVMAVGYQEPSLVFALGKQDVLMRDMRNAVSFTSGDIAQRLLLISQEQFPCFTQMANDRRLHWTSLGKIEGIQYNRGRRTIIHLILLSGVIHGHEDFNQTGILAAFSGHNSPLLFFCRSSDLDFIRSFRSSPSMAD